MVRPFFKWIVSANAAPANTAQIVTIAKIVTRRGIEAHSSNSGDTHLRDESTGETIQICHRARCVADIPAFYPCVLQSGAGRSASSAQARTGRVTLSAIEQHRS